MNLLHCPACGQVAEIDRSEPCAVEQLDDVRFCFGVVAGDEDHAPAAGLVWIRAENFGFERVGSLHESRAGNEVGDELAGRPSVQIVGSPVVGRVDDDLAVPGEALHGLGHSVPLHGDDDDAGRSCLVYRPCRDPLAEGIDH